MKSAAAVFRACVIRLRRSIPAAGCLAEEPMIQQLFQRITEVAGGNQFLVGAISMWGLGVLTYIGRSVPRTVWDFSKKHITTSLTITSAHESFYNLLHWLEAKGYGDKCRRIKLTNGRWGDSALAKSVGMGRHLFWFRHRPMLIELIRMDTHSDKDKEEITIVKLGRSHWIFDVLIQELRTPPKREDVTKIISRSDECWSVTRQPLRQMNTIFIEHEKKKAILEALKKFQDDESWYVDHGIPYQFGLLLYGPPGTGKTSLIRAIAAVFGYDIRTIPAWLLPKLKDFSPEEDEKCILVVEDVDSSEVLHRRKSGNRKSDSASMDKFFGGISDVLNVLDGVCVDHGRIIVMTTNHLEDLDPALIRPGRVDLKVRLGYVTGEVFDDFCECFFENRPGLGNPSVDTTVAQLQNDAMLGLSLEEIISKYYVDSLPQS
jgi:mitochondrial chaperone BCS1